MKSKILFSFLLLLMSFNWATSQEKSKKEKKAEAKLENQKKIETLVNGKIFQFVARTAMPQGYRSIDLSTNPNYLIFSPERFISRMPYYGKAYNVGYGTADNGLSFDGAPSEYTLEKGKKKYEIKAVIKGESDTYTIQLSVGWDGNANLSINSGHRAPISYIGEILPIEVVEEVKSE